MDKIRTVKIAALRGVPDSVSDEALKRITRMMEKGLSPIVNVDSRYTLLDGKPTVAALRSLGYDTVLVRVK